MTCRVDVLVPVRDRLPGCPMATVVTGGGDSETSITSFSSAGFDDSFSVLVVDVAAVSFAGFDASFSVLVVDVAAS